MKNHFVRVVDLPCPPEKFVVGLTATHFLMGWDDNISGAEDLFSAEEENSVLIEEADIGFTLVARQPAKADLPVVHRRLTGRKRRG